MPDRVSITRAKFPPNRENDVIAQFQNDVIPTFQQMKQQGLVRQAIFVVDRKSNEAIGIAIYTSEAELQSTEGKRGSDDPRGVRDPGNAPTNFAKHRAKSVKDSGANMDDSEWYDLIGEV